MEFLKDYDVNFQYHPGKADVVADALSRRLYLTLGYLMKLPADLCEEFLKLELNVVDARTKSILHAIKAQLTHVERIRIA